MRRLIDFPDEWGTGEPVDQMALSSGEGPDAIYIFGTLLDDGSNLFALIYPGGHRFVRSTYLTDWAIEERLGPDPRPEDAERVAEAWRELLGHMIWAAHEADDEMRAAGLPSAAEQARAYRRAGGS